MIFENLLLELIDELLVRIVQDPEYVVAQFSGTMPQSVVMGFVLRSFRFVVVLHL